MTLVCYVSSCCAFSAVDVLTYVDTDPGMFSCAFLFPHINHKSDLACIDGLYYHKAVFKRGDEWVHRYQVDTLSVSDARPHSVLLNSQADDTEDVWIGQIWEVRTTEDHCTVKVKVRWYWSGNDVKSDCLKTL